MRFGAEMKVWRDGVFKELNQQIATEKQCHGADDGFGRSLTAKVFRPNANCLGNDLQEDRGQHKAGAKCHEVLQEAFAKAVRARLDEHKSAHQVCGCGQQAKEKKSDKSPG